MTFSIDTSWQQNVKQVLRVALIGLQPSHQVAIKGYLRVLLRVDFDLEWVPAQHESVNLFIINQQFSSAESVKNLLITKPVPTLFVDERDDITNTISNNVLYLKLSDLKLLEKWLYANVPMINSHGYARPTNDVDNQVAVIVHSTLAEQTATPKVSDRVIAEQIVKTQNTTNTAVMHSDMYGASSATIITENTLKLLCLINEHDESGLFNVFLADKLIAVIEPKKRQVWPKGDSYFPAYSCDWRVELADATENDAAHAMNLSQWVWQSALSPKSNVSELLATNIKLGLKTWPKPVANEIKSECIKVLSYIEMKPASARDLSRILDIEIEKTHKVMAALYLGGFLNITAFAKADVLATEQMNSQRAQFNNKKPAVTLQNESDKSSNSPTVESWQQPDKAEEISANDSNEVPVFISEKQLQHRKRAGKQAGGILSRIRSSLGF